MPSIISSSISSKAAEAADSCVDCEELRAWKKPERWSVQTTGMTRVRVKWYRHRSQRKDKDVGRKFVTIFAKGSATSENCVVDAMGGTEGPASWCDEEELIFYSLRYGSTNGKGQRLRPWKQIFAENNFRDAKLGMYFLVEFRNHEEYKNETLKVC